jgi:predicted aspartyl protease
MGRVSANVTVTNLFDEKCAVHCTAMVDTGASHLVLPQAWKGQMGKLKLLATGQVETADGTRLDGEVCGPVQIQVDDFRPVIAEVMFIEMTATEDEYEPLLGYVVLEAIPAAVDMREHRLTAGRLLPLKFTQRSGKN